MKKMKCRACAAALAAALTLSLSACGGTTDGKDPLAAAQEKMKSVTSMDAQMVMEMDMEGMGQSLETSTTMDMVYFSDPLKMKVELSMDMGAAGKQSSTIYADEQDGSYTAYIGGNGSWVSQSVSAEDLEQYNAKDSMDLYLTSGSDFKESGTEQVGGADAVRYDGVIKGEALREVMETSGALNSLGQLSQLGMDEAQIDGMLNDLGNMSVSVWLDKKDGYPVKYEMDMTETMNSLMGKMVEALGDQMEGFEMSFPKMIITINCSNFNNATAFDIPAEALAA